MVLSAFLVVQQLNNFGRNMAANIQFGQPPQDQAASTNSVSK